MLRFLYESLGASALLLTALLALRCAPRDRGRFSLIAGLGTLGLTVDEVLGLHERLGRAMYEDFDWGDPPLVNHWDDLVVAAIGLAGFAVIALLREQVLARRMFASWFGAGLALFAMAIGWDSVASTKGSASWYMEETLELMAGGCMAVAFALRFRWLGGRQDSETL